MDTQTCSGMFSGVPWSKDLSRRVDRDGHQPFLAGFRQPMQRFLRETWALWSIWEAYGGRALNFPQPETH